MKILCTSLVLATTVLANQERPPFPRERFVPWNYRQAGPVMELGYTEETWNRATNLNDSNEIEDRKWSELTTDTKGSLGVLGIDQDQWSCWIHKFDDFVWGEMPDYARQGLEALGWAKDSWNAFNGSLTPTTYNEHWDQLTPGQRAGAESICFTRQIWEEKPLDQWYHYIPPAQLEYPVIRFTPWSRLDTATKDIAKAIGYNASSWDEFTYKLEKQDWGDLTPEQQGLYEQLGFDQPQYDCYINHFEGYFYADLKLPTVDLTATIRKLGYDDDGEAWDFGPVPVPVKRYWRGLNEEQIAAVKEICHDPYTWDVVPLTRWVYYVSPESLKYPSTRDTPWDLLGETDQDLARVLGYSKETWQAPGTGDVDKEGWNSLDDEEQEAAEDLGWEQASWDCYVNHFQDYFWEDLDRPMVGVTAFYATLGFDRDSWDLGPAPAAASLEWEELSDTQRAAMESLCWTKELWSGTAALGNRMPKSSGESGKPGLTAFGVLLLIGFVALLGVKGTKVYRKSRSNGPAPETQVSSSAEFA